MGVQKDDLSRKEYYASRKKYAQKLTDIKEI